MTTRILLADDHKIMRTGLRALLADVPDFEVVGEADNGRDALRLAEELRPDVIVMDIAMSGLNGIDATRRIVRNLPTTRVLALSMHSDR